MTTRATCNIQIKYLTKVLGLQEFKVSISERALSLVDATLVVKVRREQQKEEEDEVHYGDVSGVASDDDGQDSGQESRRGHRDKEEEDAFDLDSAIEGELQDGKNADDEDSVSDDDMEEDSVQDTEKKTTEPMNEYEQRLNQALLKQEAGGSNVELNAIYEEAMTRQRVQRTISTSAMKESSLMTM